MSLVTITTNFTWIKGHYPLDAVIKAIRKPKNTALIAEIRRLYKSGGNAYQNLKRQLRAFIVTGVYVGSIVAECMKSYTGLLILDFDKLGSDLMRVHSIILNDKHTHAAFISPSGDGIKVIVSVDSDQKYHAAAFRQVAQYYQRITGAEVDMCGRNINRICYESYDPNALYNPTSQKFKVDLTWYAQPAQLGFNWE